VQVLQQVLLLALHGKVQQVLLMQQFEPMAQWLGQRYVGVNKVNIPANASRPPVLALIIRIVIRTI
jgi:hypothetical protein